MTESQGKFRVGVDIGGTCDDESSDGTEAAAPSPTTPSTTAPLDEYYD